MVAHSLSLYIAYEKLTTMTTLPGLPRQRRNIPIELAMYTHTYMAMAEGMLRLSSLSES
jgi:hypothetical protein